MGGGCRGGWKWLCEGCSGWKLAVGAEIKEQKWSFAVKLANREEAARHISCCVASEVP